MPLIMISQETLWSRLKTLQNCLSLLPWIHGLFRCKESEAQNPSLQIPLHSQPCLYMTIILLSCSGGIVLYFPVAFSTGPSGPSFLNFSMPWRRSPFWQKKKKKTQKPVVDHCHRQTRAGRHSLGAAEGAWQGPALPRPCTTGSWPCSPSSKFTSSPGHPNP